MEDDHDAVIYNGLGQRVQQTVSGVVTEYLLDVQPGLAKVIAAMTGANTERFVHVRGLLSQQDSNGDWQWMVTDGLGSVRGVVDGAGFDPAYSVHYAPYGQPWGEQGTEQTPFGFTGEPTDDNGLVHLRARYYNPALGVFPSLDSLEGVLKQAMSLNRYAYVAGNVVNLVDPSGLIHEIPPLMCQGEQSTTNSFAHLCIPACQRFYPQEPALSNCVANCVTTPPIPLMPPSYCTGELVGNLTPMSQDGQYCGPVFVRHCSSNQWEWNDYYPSGMAIFEGDTIIAFDGTPERSAHVSCGRVTYYPNYPNGPHTWFDFSEQGGSALFAQQPSATASQEPPRDCQREAEEAFDLLYESSDWTGLNDIVFGNATALWVLEHALYFQDICSPFTDDEIAVLTSIARQQASIPFMPDLGPLAELLGGNSSLVVILDTILGAVSIAIPPRIVAPDCFIADTLDHVYRTIGSPANPQWGCII